MDYPTIWPSRRRNSSEKINIKNLKKLIWGYSNLIRDTGNKSFDIQLSRATFLTRGVCAFEAPACFPHSAPFAQRGMLYVAEILVQRLATLKSDFENVIFTGYPIFTYGTFVFLVLIALPVLLVLFRSGTRDQRSVRRCFRIESQ